MQFPRFLTALALAAPLVFAVGCSSKSPTKSIEQPVTDTGPAVDAAPWLTYPEGPYGVQRGMIFPPLEMEGYIDGEGGKWGRIRIQDYYDPTGERGIYAILYVVSAEWCIPCQNEARALPKLYDKLYRGRGARFLSGMFQDKDRLVADRDAIDRWAAKFHPNFSFGIDLNADNEPVSDMPDMRTLPKLWSIPRSYIIDPRNMMIVQVNLGSQPDPTRIPVLGQFLDAAGAPKI